MELTSNVPYKNRHLFRFQLHYENKQIRVILTINLTVSMDSALETYIGYWRY